MSEKVTISVHERTDAEGFVVKIKSGDTTTRFGTDTFAEAKALAESIRGYLDAGCPLGALTGSWDGGQRDSPISDGCPRCGCADIDDFTWKGRGEQVMCDRCGQCYVPISSASEEGT